MCSKIFAMFRKILKISKCFLVFFKKEKEKQCHFHTQNIPMAFHDIQIKTKISWLGLQGPILSGQPHDLSPTSFPTTLFHCAIDTEAVSVFSKNLLLILLGLEHLLFPAPRLCSQYFPWLTVLLLFRSSLIPLPWHSM